MHDVLPRDPFDKPQEQEQYAGRFADILFARTSPLDIMKKPSSIYLDNITRFIETLIDLLNTADIDGQRAQSIMETLTVSSGNIFESPSYDDAALGVSLSHFKSVPHIKALITTIQSQPRHTAVDSLVTWAIGHGTVHCHENLRNAAIKLACKLVTTDSSH